MDVGVGVGEHEGATTRPGDVHAAGHGHAVGMLVLADGHTKPTGHARYEAHCSDTEPPAPAVSVAPPAAPVENAAPRASALMYELPPPPGEPYAELISPPPPPP